jgi:hypothetical protein
MLNGHRVVLAAILPGLESAGLADIQRKIDYYRDGDPSRLPEFGGVRKLHQLPPVLGRIAVRLGARPLHRRTSSFGTLAVTSLGHRPVDGFYSVGGTTITLGIGQVAERALVRDGQVTVAPAMRLSLTFDHRVVDGAEAADLLSDIKQDLERFTEPPDPHQGGRVTTDMTGAAQATDKMAGKK